MTREQLLEYLRTYAMLKRNISDNMGHKASEAAYDDLVQEIDRVGLLLMTKETITMIKIDQTMLDTEMEKVNYDNKH